MLKTFRAQFAGLIIAFIAVLAVALNYAPPVSLNSEIVSAMSDAERLRYILSGVASLILIPIYTSWFVLVLRKIFDWGWLWILGLTPGFFDLIETSFELLALVTRSSSFLFVELGAVTILKWVMAAALLVGVFGVVNGRSSYDMDGFRDDF